MMSEADDKAKQVCDAMVAEHAERAEFSNPGRFRNIGSRTPCGWSGTTQTSCAGTRSSHGTYRLSYCRKPGKMCM